MIKTCTQFLFFQGPSGGCDVAVGQRGSSSIRARRGDVTELQLKDGLWLGENGEPVELGALAATEKAAKPKSRLRAMAVGRPS
jgi:hypothetical protein